MVSDTDFGFPLEGVRLLVLLFNHLNKVRNYHLKANPPLLFKYEKMKMIIFIN